MSFVMRYYKYLYSGHIKSFKKKYWYRKNKIPVVMRRKRYTPQIFANN